MEPNKNLSEQTPHLETASPVVAGHERALSHLTELSFGNSPEKEHAAPSTSTASTDDPQDDSASDGSTVSLPAPLPVVSDTTVSDDTGTPLVAADEDLIEKEWVDKAKKVILETKEDPYRREQEVKKIQIDYVRKRYGRIIGDSGDQNQ